MALEISWKKYGKVLTKEKFYEIMEQIISRS
jgi:hypothetical protein